MPQVFDDSTDFGMLMAQFGIITFELVYVGCYTC